MTRKRESLAAAAMATWPLLLMMMMMMMPRAGKAQDRGAWQFERLHLQDETIVEGLLLDDRPRVIEFAQLVQPPGRPMHAVIKPFPKDQIVLIDRLPSEQHALLEQRFRQLRNRARIEADRRDAIELRPAADASADPDRVPFPEAKWRFTGEWFVLETSLQRAAAQQCIVRVEQMFRAYRHQLAPRRTAGQKLHILVTGTADEYRRLLANLQLESAAPALYLPRLNLILVGTDLLPMAEQLELTRESHQRLAAQLERQLNTFGDQFGREVSKLQASGYSEEEIAAERRARLAALQRETTAMGARIETAQRRNELLFATHCHRAFRRLYHEAFHAYLENYVLDRATRRVPRWLNEGLAQVFEHAQLDGDHLRIDSVPPELERRIRDDQRQRPLPIEEVLQSTASEFHGSRDPARAQRLYDYSWGMSHYLLFVQGESLESLLANPPTRDSANTWISQWQSSLLQP
ncbi:MAG: DUF1570 domain-containing protein [Planctomycetales bacterium]|nr:DUF1570 domain-containing protein [Planctomycetales bacterium]